LHPSLGSLKSDIIVTVVNSEVAKKGYKFIFEKNNLHCAECILKKICINKLEQGRVYEIVNIRDKEHFCKLLNGKVYIVEVKLAPIELFLECKFGVEGITITYTPINCPTPCTNIMYCKPLGVFKNDKIKIEKVLGLVYCKDGRDLVKVLSLPILKK
jgi:uncharacterized protein (UPF0179 family)